jgi:hypothetical protein
MCDVEAHVEKLHADKNIYTHTHTNAHTQKHTAQCECVKREECADASAERSPQRG